MPKTIIREFDNTQQAAGDYENFTVVIPGAVRKDLEAAFDLAYPNGIFECDNQADFLKVVGNVDAFNAVATGPIKIFEPASGAPMAEADFYGKYADKVYIIDGPSPVTGQVGYLDDGTNKYKKYEGDWESSTKGETYYAFSYEGNDASNLTHAGNQIAYELLGLNYKVIYKKIPYSDVVGKENDLDYTTLKDYAYWKEFADKSVFDFRYVCSGFMSEAGVAKDIYDCIIKLVKFLNKTDDSEQGRGDCVALIDTQEDLGDEKKTTANICAKISEYTEALDGTSKNIPDKYAAIFANKVVYDGKDFDSKYENRYFPASFNYLACAAYARENGFAEWFANAGFTRGVSKYTIISTQYDLGEVAQNYLAPRYANDNVKHATNIVAKIRGNYYIWGNRTAEKLLSKDEDLKASHFLNIRQLCISINKQLYLNCKRFTFEPNSDVLWVNFCNAITPLLDKMKANEGISDYKIIRVAATEKATLKAKLRIVPIEAVEDFYIDMYLENSIDGTVVAVSEE